MFVLGFRAKKMRQAKLAELIHNSEGHLNVESCTVEVHFQSIVDDRTPADGFEVVPNSGIIVARTAYRNSRNVYTVNGQAHSAAEVTALLKGHGIDLDHNRFLILQGEVESIAQMKPKAATEHEEGLLEYLEDIIGTADYVPQIETAARAMEEAAELFTDKQVRVRAAAKECEGLFGEKERAEGYLRQENVLTELRSQRLQALTFKTQHDGQAAGARLAENRRKLEAESAKFQAEREQIETLARTLDAKAAAVQEGERATKGLAADLQRLEQEDVRMQETRKHLKNKMKGQSRSLADAQKQRSEIARDLENTTFELKGLGEQIGTLQQSLAHEDAELGRICKSLQGVTGKYQAALDAKQRLLAPFHEKIRKEQQALELAVSARDLLRQKEASTGKELAMVQGRLEELEAEIRASAEDKERLEDEAGRLLRQMRAVEAEMGGFSGQAAELHREIDVLAATLQEARESLSQAASGGAILQALLKEKRAGRLPGIHGRLGDLGAIDAKYDTAVSTACGFLNHIVVDTTETGQRCIEHLRKHSLGRANFIILDKMRPWQPAHGLPGGAQRLFDLVRIKDTKAYSSAFYFALTDTLVAETIEEATRWAYNGPRRHRVVTLDGKLIETSGTISGGGRPQRGGMKAQLAAEGVSQEQVDQLAACLSERRLALRQLEARLSELESERQGLLDKQSRNEAHLLKAETLCRTLPAELADLQAQLPALRQGASARLSKGEHERLAGLEAAMEQGQARVAGLRSEMMPVEAEIAAIQAQIMEAGGLRFKTQKSKVDGLTDQIGHLAGRSKKLGGERSVLESRLAALEAGQKDPKAGSFEAELRALEAKIEEHTGAALAIGERLKAAAGELDLLREEQEELGRQMADFEKSHSRFKKTEYELKVRIEQDAETVQETGRLLARLAAELSTLALHHIDRKDSKPVLAVYEDAELRDLCKRLEALEQQAAVLAERLEASTPNLRVLEEYRLKEERLGALEAELALLDAARQASRSAFDELRHRRHDEFMAGFRLISHRLKEMYQLITMGGNAELELVDSLDPFSEGILFSVMPPKKSWKTIVNLSGGEKTLSSLALVFALHTYKPTPIYVMDEIDAALDFRNVSIVAHYIKERTRDAQFIVISLRNDMFELADRLVGIYKTEQRTKSVTIDPKHFSVPAPTAAI